YGSSAASHSHVPVVGMAVTPDGAGYWLAYADGSVRNFGDAHFFGSAVHIHLVAPVVSFAASPDGGGYWLAGRTGRIYNFGDAAFHGSLARNPPKAPIHVVAIVATILVPKAATTPWVHGGLGYDISGFQCTKSGSTTAEAGLPKTSAVTALEAAGWLDSADNSCLTSEAAWATSVATSKSHPYDLYLFLNSPGTGSAPTSLESSGPAGRCASLTAGVQASCRAYNYGYNGASEALTYSVNEKATSNLWWLDVENDALSSTQNSDFSHGVYWSGSTSLNDQTIQGALDALRKGGVTVGIYSTSVQYPRIAGNFVPKGPKLPLWVAGAPWTNPPYTEKGLPGASVLAAWCAGTASYAGTKGTDLFAGGTPWILQETPGNLASPYGLDPNYAC
ncbi:MAG: hypothetical protein JWM85_1558, partial [Acidimicrobiaceae bacterium]|nr:hypothetical protein [Acidimicrobiaceae bacterium]